MRISEEMPLFRESEDTPDGGMLYFDSFATLLYRFNWRGVIRTMIAVLVTARDGATPDTLVLFDNDEEGENTMVIELSSRNAESNRCEENPVSAPQSTVEQAQMSEEEAFDAACAADFLSRLSIPKVFETAQTPVNKQPEQLTSYPIFQKPKDNMPTGGEPPNPYEYETCEYKL